ncbi:MAG: hypothetical protein ACOC0N_05165 [Chroococcales cyanobacterium]
MNQTTIETALERAFRECEQLLSPLTPRQKQILRQILVEELKHYSGQSERSETENPLDELTSEQRQALLNFVKVQEEENRPWKIQLLNDWLHNRDSGPVQFIRDFYGPQWLNRIKSVHLAEYLEENGQGNGLQLKVGDRIEVSNGLWEWVQDNGPCYREWFPCTVIAISQDCDRDWDYTNCVIRFDNGAEFEIQGVYQWNRYNWRWK